MRASGAGASACHAAAEAELADLSSLFSRSLGVSSLLASGFRTSVCGQSGRSMSAPGVGFGASVGAAQIIGQGVVQSHAKKGEGMRKRRRIEITIFRRRTTIVLREGAGAGPTRWPPVDGEATPPLRADPAPAEEADPDQTQITGAGTAEQFGLSRGAPGRFWEEPAESRGSRPV